jgi:PHD/YefM family antitoxin component YafN of YafNO toxin-antitoxin module
VGELIKKRVRVLLSLKRWALLEMKLEVRKVRQMDNFLEYREATEKVEKQYLSKIEEIRYQIK